MSKTYTAQEMREFANYNDAAYARNPGLYSSAVSAALRQAADALERKKREKKYEYATIKSNKTPSMIHDDGYVAGYHVFRRRVGEWEEVKDGE